ncbi:MAG TPA: bifunctional 2-polyprenyl-6-hydroxyphenol methylase/3-demethylubiquinol 3-O-methyltransferase UbiG [Ktedonobacteraceae bacterium]|nr:bifunctional 2-polyprenyl-6-hydroxyphenol methylase/3-demethylubiquinol 3-O-methyltransferase UbiG [Ktedonobacteraceae bacterium]
MHWRKRSQEEIFASFGWWDRGCFLGQMTGDRCDYIQSRLERASGGKALRQLSILEVGCGGGLICEELARRGAQMSGVDPSQTALQTAREHASQSSLAEHITYKLGYAEALPYADSSFAAVVCLDVLEHVKDLHATIAEIARVLTPGGTFVFDTINRTLLARIILIWYGEHFPSGGLVPGLHDYRAFIKPAELRAVLAANQFQIQELTGFMPRGFVQGRFRMGPGWFKGVSYVGYATKTLQETPEHI